MDKNVTFVGKIPHSDIETEYRNCDCVIMPSIRETTGTVILESLANGRPIISLNRFGAAELLNEENAYLYDGATKADFVSNLAEEIKKVIDNKELLKRKSAQCLTTAKEFTWENKVGSYYKIYTNLLENKKDI